MSTRRQRVRLFGSVLLAFSSISACALGMPEGDAKDASGISAAQGPAASEAKAKKGGEEKPKARAEAPSPARKADVARAPSELRSPLVAAEIHCPYGLLQDPHRGFVRCLKAEEQGAKWLPPAPQAAPTAANSGSSASPSPSTSAPPSTSPPSGSSGATPSPSSSGASPAFVVPASVVSAAPSGPDAAAAPAAAAPVSTDPPVLELKGFTYENGEVPRAEKVLGKLAEEMGKCVAKNGGLMRSSASMKIQFIVRAKGRAEGVEILSSQGVSAEASACVRVLLKNKAVGEPSSDPVGVTFVLSMKPAGK